MRSRRAIHIAFALVLVVGVLGCGADEEVPGGEEGDVTDGTYVGKVEGTDAYIGLNYESELVLEGEQGDESEVEESKQVGGYVTDNRQVSIWLEPSDVSDNEATLDNRQGDEVGNVTLSPESDSGGPGGESAASGEVEVDGRPHGFEARLTEGVEGLFAARRGEIGAPGSIEVGWVVLHDGTQRGSTQIVDPEGGITVQPAPQLQLSPPGKVSVGKATLRPNKILGADLDR